MTTQTAAHTAGPWCLEGRTTTCVTTKNGRSICTTGGYSSNASDEWVEENPANAARIVACVNALEGLNPDAIADVVGFLKEIAELDKIKTLNWAHAADAALDAKDLLAKLESQP